MESSTSDSDSRSGSQDVKLENSSFNFIPTSATKVGYNDLILRNIFQFLNDSRTLKVCRQVTTVWKAAVDKQFYNSHRINLGMCDEESLQGSLSQKWKHVNVPQLRGAQARKQPSELWSSNQILSGLESVWFNNPLHQILSSPGLFLILKTVSGATFNVNGGLWNGAVLSDALNLRQLTITGWYGAFSDLIDLTDHAYWQNLTVLNLECNRIQFTDAISRKLVLKKLQLKEFRLNIYRCCQLEIRATSNFIASLSTTLEELELDTNYDQEHLEAYFGSTGILTFPIMMSKLKRLVIKDAAMIALPFSENFQSLESLCLYAKREAKAVRLSIATANQFPALSEFGVSIGTNTTMRTFSSLVAPKLSTLNILTEPWHDSSIYVAMPGFSFASFEGLKTLTFSKRVHPDDPTAVTMVNSFLANLGIRSIRDLGLQNFHLVASDLVNELKRSGISNLSLLDLKHTVLVGENRIPIAPTEICHAIRELYNTWTFLGVTYSGKPCPDDAVPSSPTESGDRSWSPGSMFSSEDSQSSSSWDDRSSENSEQSSSDSDTSD